MPLRKEQTPWNKGLKGFKHSGSFKKGHSRLKKTNKGDFVKGQIAWNRGIKGSVKPNRTSFKKSNIPWNKGKKTGLIPKTAFKKGKSVSPRTQFKKGHVLGLGKTRLDITGNKHPFWKGGVTPLHEKIRKSVKYRIWRKAIFERDNYTCQNCGKRGVKLNADHIKPFSLFPEIRFLLSNGRALCENCHKKTNTYGKGVYNYAESN